MLFLCKFTELRITFVSNALLDLENLSQRVFKGLAHLLRSFDTTYFNYYA